LRPSPDGRDIFYAAEVAGLFGGFVPIVAEPVDEQSQFFGAKAICSWIGGMGGEGRHAII
jgi:hypothetical protein